jgi:NADPH:quinone reductase-like Zn-dependent oxidoreductase
VLVRMTAASLNYRDLLTVDGGYGSWQKLPLVPMSDGAGIAEEVGEGVSRFKSGDRVINAFLPNWADGEPNEAKLSGAFGGLVDGVLTEYRAFPEQALLHTPEHLSDHAAATLACAGVTAWSAVVKLGGIKPGDTVLTQGSGGVSLFAVQFAKLAGAHVIATSSSDAKLEKLKKLGADETINYKTTPGWGKRARALTENRGVDLVVEVGGNGTLNESIRATRTGGVIAMIGVLAGSSSDLRLPLVAMQQQRIQGVACGSIEDLQAVLNAMTLHSIQPVIDNVFPFAQAREAFAYLASGQHFGKVVIAINSA